MPKTSAGLLLYRRAPGLEVLLGHMGGPFWARKDAGAWSIPKGELDEGEQPLAAARREYAEELGHPPPDGPIIELGPGTGPVTDALIRRGVAQERLVLIEYNPEFCQLLKRRFPKATIVQGDAYDLKETLSGVLQEPAAATVSSLPLFTKPMDQRLELLETAQGMMHPSAPFIQFTYAVVPPIPARSQAYKARASNRIWRNLPPARVWVYNKVNHP